MPVRRRISKRRGDPDALRKAWIQALETGFDFFGELADQGVETDHAGVPDLDAAREAWDKYGLWVIAGRDPQLGPAWGEQVFGRPGKM